LFTCDLIFQLEPFENDPHAYFVENERIGYKYYENKADKTDQVRNPFFELIDNETLILLKKIFQVMNYIFQKFNVERSDEMITSSKLIAEALKKPLYDFENMPWEEMVKKYDKVKKSSILIVFEN